MYNKQKEG